MGGITIYLNMDIIKNLYYLIYLLQNQKAKFYFIRGIGTMKILNQEYLLLFTKVCVQNLFGSVKMTKFLYPEERGDHGF